MRFQHSPAIWRVHSTLVAGVIHVSGVTATPDVRDRVRPYRDRALRRLDDMPASEFTEIQAWRRAFASMGLKPTQYRCASEALLRRLHKDGDIPPIHPLVDLCNHISASFAIPIAVFDLAHITGDLEVRPADGTERYTTFSGDVEHPAPGEVIFTDNAGNAHARRWTNRQSATSAIRATTSDVLIVAEALHDRAAADIPGVLAAVTQETTQIWGSSTNSAMLSALSPCFDSAVR